MKQKHSLKQYALLTVLLLTVLFSVSADYSYIDGKFTIDGSDIGEKTLKELTPDYASMTELEIVGEIESIPKSFGKGCKSLEKVVLPESCTFIYNYAFAGCSQLYSVKAPGVKALDAHVFDGCDNLSSIEFPVLEKIGEYALNSVNIDLNDLPETLTEIRMRSISTTHKSESFTFPARIDIRTNWLSPCITATVGTFEINHQYPIRGGYATDEPTTIHTLGITCNTLILGGDMKEFSPHLFSVGCRPDKIVIPGQEMIEIAVIYHYFTPNDPHEWVAYDIYDDFPKDWRENVTLYVADNLVEKYKANKYWNQLKIYSLSGEYSGVENVMADGNGLDVEVADGVVTVNGDGGQSVEIYSLDGKRVAAGVTGQPLNVGKGLHIIRCGSAAKKVMVK